MIFETKVLKLIAEHEVGAEQIIGVRNTVLNALDAEAFDMWLINHILIWSDQIVSESGVPADDQIDMARKVIQDHSVRLIGIMTQWTDDRVLMSLYAAFLTYFQTRLAFLDDQDGFDQFTDLINLEQARRV